MSDHPDTDAAVSSVAAELTRVFRNWRRNIELDLRVAAPAKVVTYNPATQRATLQIEFLRVLLADDGSEVPQPPDLVPGVPVQLPGGSAGYVAPPIVPGDTGLIVFTDRCLSVWRNAGGPVDPINRRTHDVADAVFIPGVRHGGNAIVPAPPTSATVVEGPTIQLGAGGAEAVLKGTTLATTAASLSATLSAVPPAVDLATALTAIAANKAAILGLLSAITSAVSTKTFTI